MSQGIKGGQGRDPDDLRASADFCTTLVAIAVLTAVIAAVADALWGAS